MIPVPTTLKYAAVAGAGRRRDRGRGAGDDGASPPTALAACWPGGAGAGRPAAARIARVFDLVLRGLEGVRTPAHLIPLAVWTVLIWSLGALGAWSLFRAVHLDLPLLAGWTVLTFVGFGISIPSAPGYIGVWHAAAVLALSLFGVSQAPAVGYALLYHASQFVPITLLGWLFLLREHVTLGEVTRTRPAERPAA